MTEQSLFREALSRLSTAVNIISTDGAAGLQGLTASAVCSVSDNPATILVCIKRSSRANAVIKSNGVLGISILGADQEQLSRRFSTSGMSPQEKFGNEGNWFRANSRAPLLNEALAVLDCTITATKEIGSHSVLFCDVVDIQLGDLRHGLVYFNRGYYTTTTTTGDAAEPALSSTI